MLVNDIKEPFKIYPNKYFRNVFSNYDILVSSLVRSLPYYVCRKPSKGRILQVTIIFTARAWKSGFNNTLVSLSAHVISLTRLPTQNNHNAPTSSKHSFLSDLNKLLAIAPQYITSNPTRTCDRYAEALFTGDCE